MKRLLTLISMLAILFVGCATSGGPAIKPMPNFSEPDAVLEITDSMPFSCVEALEIPVGIFTKFEGLLPEQYKGRQYFGMWVFTETNDLILVRAKDANGQDVIEVWYDYGRDMKPEVYYPYLDERVPGFPDICKSLEQLRK